MKNALREAGAFPVISKKFGSYCCVNYYLARMFGKRLCKELKEFEIESKLEVESETEPSNIFNDIKRFFMENNSGFTLPLHYPYTHESASINRYYRGRDGVFKILMRESNARIVTKSGMEIAKDMHNLDCIVKRREVKGEIISIFSGWEKSSELIGEINRKRKAFWLDRPETQRTYHISFDWCHSGGRDMHQIEIEYVGTYVDIKPEDTKEDEIIKDIADITLILLKEFPSIRSSQLTKMDWVSML